MPEAEALDSRLRGNDAIGPSRHPREGGDPAQRAVGLGGKPWIPAFPEMTPSPASAAPDFQQSLEVAVADVVPRQFVQRAGRVLQGGAVLAAGVAEDAAVLGLGEFAGV